MPLPLSSPSDSQLGSWHANGAMLESNGLSHLTMFKVLDPREDGTFTTGECMELQYPTIYVLVQMLRTKASVLNGLQPGALPITPLSRMFTISAANGSKTTVTPAYAFTDH